MTRKQKTRPNILALDLDGTLLSYDGYHEGVFGTPFKGMVEQLHILKKSGWVIVIWTCRQDTPELRHHLDFHEIPYDHINKHPWDLGRSRKMGADIYLDDRGLQFNGISDNLANEIMDHRFWWEDVSW